MNIKKIGLSALAGSLAVVSANAVELSVSGKTEVTYNYDYNINGSTPRVASIRIDIVTDKYVIEGGLDKRSSLDSIQQAVFASTLTGKKPAVAIYDTNGSWGKYEHRIYSSAKQLGIKFFWVSGNKIHEK